MILSAGSFIIWIVGNNYALVILGNTIASLSQVTIFCAVGPLVERYMSHKLSSFLLPLPFMCNAIGNGIGLFLPVYLMNDSEDFDEIYNVMKIINGFSLIATLPSVIFLIPYLIWKIDKELPVLPLITAGTIFYLKFYIEKLPEVKIGYFEATWLVLKSPVGISN